MFEGPRSKVKRANEHIDDLNAEIARFFESGDIYEVRVDYDAEKRCSTCVAEIKKQLPTSIPLIIGDAAHNMRSALDILACDIVKAAGLNPTKYTKFPFRPSRNELIAAINGGSLKSSRPVVINAIIDVIQPYPGGNGDPLSALHELDIDDKHFNVLPVVHVTKIRNICGYTVRGNNAFYDIDVVLHGGKVNLVTFREKIELTNYGPVSFGVFFGEGQPFARQRVIPTLHKLSQLVSGAIDAIEKSYA